MKKIRYTNILFMIAFCSCFITTEAFSLPRLSNHNNDNPIVKRTNNAIKTNNRNRKAFFSIPSSRFRSLNKIDKADFTVTGKVTDANSGSPLPGVNVYVKGTTVGTSTNKNGKYSLNVPSKTDTLMFSYIGYKSKSMPIQGRSTINVKLSTHIINGQQVVVVGYGTQKQKDLTSSISSVNSQQIQNNPVQQVGQALQGKVAGVQIMQNSGTPGAGLTVRIRGTGTVNNSQPLYVVDGNPNVNPSNIDPSNIKSIQVLKSAAAAAIYGSRGANGVILITTKQGVSGQTNLKVNAYDGVQNVHRMIPMVTARQYAQLYDEALKNAGEKPYFNQLDTLGVGTNWQKAIFRPAPIRKVQLSASGGNKKNTYFVSGGYFAQKGVIKGSNYDRLSFRVNSTHKINSYLKLGENMSLGYAKRSNIPEFAPTTSVVIHALNMDPTQPIKYPNGNWGSAVLSNSTNPVAQIYYNHNTTTHPNLNGDVYLDITPIKNLVYKSQFNINYGYSENTVFDPTYYIDNNNENLTSSLTRTENHTKDWVWQNTITYKKSIGHNNFKILGGITAQNNTIDNINATGTNLPANSNTDPSLRYLGLVTAGQNVGGGANSYGMLSFLGRVNYDYKDTYLATINIRRDGSSKFGKNNRFGTFPSFSVGWRISNEPFMQQFKFINDLKLRGGWGELGNQNSLSDYAYANTVTSGLAYPFGYPSKQILLGQAPTSLGNPNLKWEATKETDVGIDFSGFKNSLSLHADYYNKKTTNMLLQEPIPLFTGIETPPFVNGGEVVNRGVELSVEYQKTSPGGFYYDISANVAHNHNVVKKLSNAGAYIPSGNYQSIGYVQRTAVGHPISSFYGYVFQGIFQNQQQVKNHATQEKGTAPGDAMFKDINGDGVINSKDQTYLGSPWPSMTYGLNADLAWKNFDFNLTLKGVYGNKIFAAWKYYTEASNFFNKDIYALNAWHGQGTTNSIPRMDVADPNNNYRTSSWYLQNGSYLRVKNVQLGYTLPARIIHQLHLQKLRIYVSAENLLTFTAYKGLDPQVGYDTASNNPLNIGVDYGNYPVARTITFGINLNI